MFSNSVLPSLRTGTSCRKGKRESDTERQREAVNTEREEVILKDRGNGGKRESDLERQQVILRNRGKGDQIESNIERQGEKGKREREREGESDTERKRERCKDRKRLSYIGRQRKMCQVRK